MQCAYKHAHTQVHMSKSSRVGIKPPAPAVPLLSLIIYVMEAT